MGMRMLSLGYHGNRGAQSRCQQHQNQEESADGSSSGEAWTTPWRLQHWVSAAPHEQTYHFPEFILNILCCHINFVSLEDLHLRISKLEV